MEGTVPRRPTICVVSVHTERRARPPGPSPPGRSASIVAWWRALPNSTATAFITPTSRGSSEQRRGGRRGSRRRAVDLTDGTNRPVIAKASTTASPAGSQQRRGARRGRCRCQLMTLASLAGTDDTVSIDGDRVAHQHCRRRARSVSLAYRRIHAAPAEVDRFRGVATRS